MKLRLLTALAVALIATFAAAAGAEATSTPGMSLAQASSQIEFHIRLVIPAVVAKAQDTLRLYKQLGGAGGIRQAQQDLDAAKTGMEVDNASCLGTRAAAGGYSAFRCKLSLSDDLGFKGKALGTYSRTAGGWRWWTTSFTLIGYGPWNEPIHLGNKFPITVVG